MLVIAMLAISTVPVSAQAGDTTQGAHIDKKLERVQQRHDRKGELRASILGLTPDELRSQLKTKSFKQILKEHGFSSDQAYHQALLGKVKDELRRRGWDDKKIQQFIQKKLHRAEG